MTGHQSTLKWMKFSAVAELNGNIAANLDRYRSGDFEDLASHPDWNQRELFAFDDSNFSKLSGNSKSDLDDSLIIYSALQQLEPRLATCMNVWVYLIHTSLLNYARSRWFKMSGSDDDLVKDIEKHVFKGGIGGYRDDNAAGRPWWTGYIGSRIAGSNDCADIRKALAPLMRTTDTRSNVIERSGIFSEVGLARSISDYLAENRLPNSENESTFRNFVINVNHRSTGLYFGDFTRKEYFEFLDSCQ